MIQICKKPELCTGCGACANTCPKDAIQLKDNEYGFIYPVIDETKCIECGLCSKVCDRVFENRLSTPVKAYACTIKDKDVLMKSSSGGVFSAIAEYVLENGGAVCGCVYDENLKPIHICSEKQEDYFLMRKSKYMQSDVLLSYRDVKERLNNGQMVLFTGTPCQVSGLKGYLGKDYENLITMDLICHGVPSYAMFNEFKKYLEKKHKTKIVSFDFRSKKYTWQRFTMEFTNIKGKVKNIGKTDEFYMYAFATGNIMRSGCYECRYATDKRVGDITVGDLWGHEELNLKCDKINGISVCTFNNDKALAIYEVLSDKMLMEEIDYSYAVKGNTCLRRPTQKGTKWEKYMEAYKNGKIADMAVSYQKNNIKRRIRGKIRLIVPLKLFNLVKKFHL